jgi:ribosome biogenesis GTPase
VSDPIREKPGAPDPADPALTRPESALVRLGFERFEVFFAEHVAAGLVPARVLRTDRGSLLAATDEGVVRAETAVHLLKSASGPEALPAVGDWVALRTSDGVGVPLVEVVLSRTSAFVRRDPGKAAVGQVLAANIDVVFVVHPIDAEPNVRRIERELALAWESGATPVVVLSKQDLAPDPEGARIAVEAVALGVDVLLESAVTGDGVDALLRYADGHRTVALIGPSGAGKSKLINRIVGSDVQAIGEVRAFDHKGRHTTMARELVPLPGGGVLVDTPGLRQVAMWGADDGVTAAFPEIEALAAGCRFDDCTHTAEPGCAVLAALESGELPAERYESYMSLRREMGFEERKRDGHLRAEETRKWKILHKSARALYRHKYGE